jgi:hypothetical protein
MIISTLITKVLTTSIWLGGRPPGFKPTVMHNICGMCAHLNYRLRWVPS